MTDNDFRPSAAVVKQVDTPDLGNAVSLSLSCNAYPATLCHQTNNKMLVFENFFEVTNK